MCSCLGLVDVYFMYTKYIILKLQPNTNDYHIVKEPCLIYSLLCILYTVHKDPKQKKNCCDILYKMEIRLSLQFIICKQSTCNFRHILCTWIDRMRIKTNDRKETVHFIHFCWFFNMDFLQLSSFDIKTCSW